MESAGEMALATKARRKANLHQTRSFIAEQLFCPFDATFKDILIRCKAQAFLEHSTKWCVLSSAMCASSRTVTARPRFASTYSMIFRALLYVKPPLGRPFAREEAVEYPHKSIDAISIASVST